MTLKWKLRRVEGTIRKSHYHLMVNDWCCFFHEYTARMGYRHSDANSFISNLKKPVSKRGRPEYKYKTEAINQAGKNFAQALGSQVDQAILIPVPPSKSKSHPDYDDRMSQVLQCLKEESEKRGHQPMVSELVEQIESRPAVHMGENRPGVDELMQNYKINEQELKRVRESERVLVAVFDDVLTAGTHFKAMQKVIVKAMKKFIVPEVPFSMNYVAGFFIARRVSPPEDENIM